MPRFSLPRPASAAVFVSLVALLQWGCGEKAVARINSEVIRFDEFERQLRILKSLRPETTVDELTKRQVLEQMVKQELLSLEAKKAGLHKDPSVLAAMEKQRRLVKDELVTSIKNAQAQLDQLDRAVEQKILIESFLEFKKNQVEVSEDEIKNAYDERRRQAPGSTGALKDLKDQLRQQVQLEKLVESAKGRHHIELYPEVASQGKLD